MQSKHILLGIIYYRTLQHLMYVAKSQIKPNHLMKFRVIHQTPFFV